METLLNIAEYIDGIQLHNDITSTPNKEIQSLNEVKIEKVLTDVSIINAIKKVLAENGYELIIRVLPKNKINK